MSANQPVRSRRVVIGAGFGGLSAAHAPSKLPVEVTVIVRNNRHLFQRLLHQVATAALSPGDIAPPVCSILAKHTDVDVLHGEVDGIDAETRRVSTRGTGAIA